MSGSRLATTVRPWPPPAPANLDRETRDPVTSPPLPVPDRIARGQPPPRLAAPFCGRLNSNAAGANSPGRELTLPQRLWSRMIEATSDGSKTWGVAHVGSQPIAIAAVALVILVIGAGSIAVWRASTGSFPESDRVLAARQVQARAVQASEQLVERTKALEISQQEAIDQLQIVHDELQTVKRLLAAQQNDAKRLSDQLNGLAGAIDSLRQSFASAQPGETSARHAGAPKSRNKRRAAQGR
jgi:uncharacterized protein YoxC